MDVDMSVGGFVSLYANLTAFKKNLYFTMVQMVAVNNRETELNKYKSTIYS